MLETNDLFVYSTTQNSTSAAIYQYNINIATKQVDWKLIVSYFDSWIEDANLHQTNMIKKQNPVYKYETIYDLLIPKKTHTTVSSEKIFQVL